MPDFAQLPSKDGNCYHVVVETPKGGAAKISYDTALKCFALSRPLPLGLTYPYDWGFIPSTKGEDGDPLDGLIIHDAATWPGVIVVCRLLGALMVEQTQDGTTERNDRFVFRPRKSPRSEELKDVEAISQRTKTEIEQFFLATILGTGKKLKFLGWQGPEHAAAAIVAGQRAFDEDNAE